MKWQKRIVTSITADKKLNRYTCMCVHACAGTSFFMWREGGVRRRRRGMHLPYHLFWPAVTETIWTLCQNLIREWKRPREVLDDWNKERGKSSAIWETRRRERKTEGHRAGKREADKDALEAERKLEVKECEIWHSTESVVMGQGSLADL